MLHPPLCPAGRGAVVYIDWCITPNIQYSFSFKPRYSLFSFHPRSNSPVAYVTDALNLLYRINGLDQRFGFRRVRGLAATQATALLVRDIKYHTMPEMLWYDHSNVTLSAILSPDTIFSWVVSLDLFFTHAILMFSMTAKVLCELRRLSQERVRWYSGFQVTGMIEWRQKWNPKISLGLPTKPEKNPWNKI